MRPQSAKAKGRRFQQKVVASVLKAFPHLNPDDVVSTSMGCGGEDVRMSPLARESLPLSLECKCQERLNVWSCVEQARRNCPEGATGCVVFSKNHEETYAVVPWATLLDLFVAARRQDAQMPTRAVELITELATFVSPSRTPPPAPERDACATPDRA